MFPAVPGCPALKTEDWAAAAAAAAAGLPEAPPTGPPAAYPPPGPLLLVGRFWFSPLADWVSSQSVRCSECCLFCLADKGEEGEGQSDGTHFSIFCQVNLQRFGIVLEA